MIKVTFNKPTNIVMHGTSCKVLSCEAFYKGEIGYYTQLFFGSFNDNCFVLTTKIKSIEFINPNEL